MTFWETPGGLQAEDLAIFQTERAKQRGDDNSFPQRDGYGLIFHYCCQYKKQEVLQGSQQEEGSQGVNSVVVFIYGISLCQ